ncbi:MAG: carboxypeptidase regulatory-like domain-containing protein [Gemmatimonadota bacterium]
MIRMRSIPSYAMLAALVVAAAACDRPDSSGPAPDGVITGLVSGPSGPEAGVWVIAETDDLGTRFAKIVVTDDEGRFLLPELPDASYAVWARGYGLVDSDTLTAEPGAELEITARPAPDAQAAAYYYPAGSWFSLIDVPPEDAFPGTGPSGNGISPDIRHQADWLRQIKSGNCMACHQLGSLGTRVMPEGLAGLDSEEAWQQRVLAGQAGQSMSRGLDVLGRTAATRMFADWTDRIAAGEVPPAPRRPEGIERNVVITQWDWADPTDYLHDVVSTDRRDPTVNANGPVYGALELSADYLPVVDPVTNDSTGIPLTPRDPATEPAASPSLPAPSPYWGDEVLWDSRTNVHNPMIDHRGRVWLTATVRPPENPDVCREGSAHPSAEVFPRERAGRHLAVWEPATKELTHVGTCFSTHHLMFAEDEDHTLWTSGGGPAIGWLNTRVFDETGDETLAQGWTPLVLDTNGNGRRDAWVEPGKPADPTMDTRITSGYYAVSPAPDGSVWGSSLGYPGAVLRLVPGDDPTHTALVERYELPLDETGRPVEGFSPRGMDIDRNGVAWVALASGHMGRFDRSACEGPLNGPEATGQHCPEGWTFFTEPLPQVGGVTASGSAEASYYTWVDQFGVLGLGDNVPINTGNVSEGLLVLDDGEWVVLRVPYPLGFYTKWMDGRIDDPEGGWKGRGLWATVSTRAPFHMEGGAERTSYVAKFQLRPGPLAN